MKEHIGLLMYLMLGLLKAFLVLGGAFALLGVFVALGYFGMMLVEHLFWNVPPVVYHL